MPTWRDELTTRLQSLRLSPEREADIVEELSQHLDDRVADLEAAGSTPEAARGAALADLDAPGELARRLAAIEARSPYQLPAPGAPARGRWIVALWQDTRYSIRSLRRSPAFTATVVAALALTIGPTTAMLSVGNWLLWRPAPGVARPDRLAVVWFGDWRGATSVSPRSVSPQNLDDLRAASRTFDAIAGWQESSVSFAVDGVAPRHVGSAHATANLFEVLGVRPTAGRTFTEEENIPPYGAPVALVSDSLARSVFGGAEAALGRSMLINGRALTVVGVTPPGFVGASPFSHVDVWLPSETYYYVRHFNEASMSSRVGRAGGGSFYTFIARLRPEATFEAMQIELDVLVPALAEQYPDDNKAFASARARVFGGLGPHELQRGSYQSLVRTLLLVGGVLLLLGCANVANLLISRGVRRERERAVRVALGASRRRLIQLQLTESAVLAVAGAAVGIGLAVWLKELVKTLLLPEVAGSGVEFAVPMDGRVLAATLGISLTCGLVAGLAPAVLGSSGRAVSDLRTSTGASRVRTGLAVVQLALSLALVTNALLLVTTLRNLSGVPVGFDPRGVSVHYLDLGSHGYDAARSLAYDRQLVDRLSSDPAVERFSLSSNHPFGSGYITRLDESVGEPAGGNAAGLDVYTNLVTDEYFGVLGIPLVRGRTFDRAETLTKAGVDGTPVVLDELLARRLFGDAEPLGRSVRVARTRSDPAHNVIVIGVTRNARWRGLTRDPDLVMYLPFAYGGRFAASRPVLMVRSPRPLGEVARAVQGHASAIDASLPVAAPQALTASIERELADRRVFAWVLSLLGGLGFVLAAVGLYGLLAQMVSERTREFGIRLAIGADRRHVFGLVLRQASWIALFGGAAGLGLAALGSRGVEAQLFGVDRLEPWLYVASAAALTAVTFAASTWPARAATRIEPIQALRTE